MKRYLVMREDGEPLGRIAVYNTKPATADAPGAVYEGNLAQIQHLFPCSILEIVLFDN